MTPEIWLTTSEAAASAEELDKVGSSSAFGTNAETGGSRTGVDESPAVVVADAEALAELGPDAERHLRWRTGDLPLVVLADSASRVPGEPLGRRIQRLCGAGESAEHEAHRDLKRQHDRIMRELRMAEQVQRSMLPKSLPRLTGASFGAAFRPCEHLAGDFYNAFRLDRDHVGFYLGDVMGHGAASALLGVYAMQVIRTKKISGNSYSILSPNESLQSLNRDLIAGDFPGDPFVTMVYAVLNVPQRRLTFSSAGHPPMLLLRPGQEARRLDASGFVLGMIEVTYEVHEWDLEPGDRVVMFSDGIDAVRWGDYGLGTKGLAQALSIRDGRSLQEVVDDALRIADGSDDLLVDDLTVLMVEIQAV